MKTFSVTRVLSVYNDFSGINPDVLQAAARRGTKVHGVCAAYAAGLWVPPLALDINGYFSSFKAWFDKYVSRVFFVEEEMVDPLLGYYGHPDLGVELIDGRKMIPDLKTPLNESVTWKSQIAAYLNLAEKKYGENFFDGCMALQLSPKGTMAKGIVYQYSDADFAAFLSALNAYRYFKG